MVPVGKGEGDGLRGRHKQTSVIGGVLSLDGVTNKCYGRAALRAQLASLEIKKNQGSS